MSIRTVSSAGVLAILFACGYSAAAQTGAEEERCRSMLDGQVAWNQAGDNAWEPENIDALCAGATDAGARIACFEAGIADHNDWARAISECAAEPGAIEEPPQEVAPADDQAGPDTGSEETRCRSMLEGQVAWNQNGDTSWDPANIEALCAGAKNAEARIACFNAGIEAHDDWGRAISDCVADDSAGPHQPEPEPEAGPMPPSPQPAEAPEAGGEPAPGDEAALCRILIQGKIPMSMPNGSTNWDDARLNGLCAGSVNAYETMKCFLKTILGDANGPVPTDQAIDICRAR